MLVSKQLCSWGILVEQDKKYYPTNAYAILTGTGPLHFAIQCGVFKGTTKEIFVDRREYTGPLWEQIEQAYQFALRNIRMGASFQWCLPTGMFTKFPQMLFVNIQIALYR